MLCLWRGYFNIKHQKAEGTHHQMKLMLRTPAQTTQGSSHPQPLLSHQKHVAALHPRHRTAARGREEERSPPTLFFVPLFFFPPSQEQKAGGNAAAPTWPQVMSLHQDQQTGKGPWVQCELSGPTSSAQLTTHVLPTEGHSAAHCGIGAAMLWPGGQAGRGDHGTEHAPARSLCRVAN